jgi:hypothetical protein
VSNLKQKRNVFTYLGFAFVGLVMFWLGYQFGIVPSDEEMTDEEYRTEAENDLMTVAEDYGTLYSLCEEKYGYAIDGDFDSALIIVGQMEAIEAEIEGIQDKYNDNTKIKPL